MLIIIRGIPGSGKSTAAREINEDNNNQFKHFEADMFFMDKGEYKFNPKKIKVAHEWCRTEVRKALAEDDDVIVSNTFTQLWEMEDYIKMADELSRTVVVIKCTREYQNIHGVPEAALARMKDRWEDYDGEQEWPCEL